MTSLSGWIVYNGNLATEKFMDYVRWFQKTAEKQNINVVAKPNNSLLVTIADGKPLLTTPYKENQLLERKPDFIHFADKDLHLARHLEVLGIPMFNTARAIEL